jgi:hypothetical protein
MEEYMKPSSRQSKPPFKLHESLNKQLSMYSVAACAAGVGILALAEPTEARIVYTPANVKIIPNKGLIFFDLNHDGIPDFGLSNIYTHTSFQAAGFLKVVQAQSANEVWNYFQKDPTVGLAMAFSNFEGTYFGPWRKVKQAYLGLKFVIKGKTHFGWARVKGNFNSFPYTATLTGYAYETIPGKSIKAGQTKGTADNPSNGDLGPGASLTNPIPDTPQPASLGMLALGAQGVTLWRRKENESVVQAD